LIEQGEVSMIMPVKVEKRVGLYQRGRLWWMSYRVGARRIRESTGYTDRKGAELVLAKVRVAIKERKWFGKSTEIATPLSQAIDDFMTLYSKPRKASWKDDQSILNLFQNFVGENVTLQEIDRFTVERFLRQVFARPVTPARVNRYIAALKSFWYRQIEWGKALVNPLKGIKLYPETMNNDYLEVEQVRSLLDACSARLRPIVQVGVLTGLRRGDVLNLRWDSIDFPRRLISVVQGKTQSALTLHISLALEGVLRGILRDANCPYVFQEGGKPLNKQGWIRTDFKKAWRAAGLPAGKWRFHTLRHTVATQLRFLGKDLALIKEQLGHKTLRMTLRYAHLAPKELQRAADDLGEKLMGESRSAGSLVTIWSHSPLAALPEKSDDDQINANFRSEFDSGVVGAGGGMSQTVNAATHRREDPEDDDLRRADDSWD
jgi:integrase